MKKKSQGIVKTQVDGTEQAKELDSNMARMLELSDWEFKTNYD